MTGYWWVAFFQFIVMGLFGMAALAIPKFHHFAKHDRPYILGIAITCIVFSLIGLLFMSLEA